MIFRTPSLGASTKEKLERVDQIRQKLGNDIATPSPWLGTLRRQLKAQSAESSTSIEGYSVRASEALAAVDGVEPSTPTEDYYAVASYSRAMDHVGVLATDPHFAWSERVILDLHFDACYFQRDKSPGHWRTGPISVTGDAGDGIAFVGPHADEITSLMSEVTEWLATVDGEHPIVRGAMAHLHVVTVHPFRDGNGRIARIVQSLVLGLEDLLAPEFGSIEEYLASHTPAYYRALRETQGGSYQPDRDASGWVEFCVDAHLAQAQQRLREIQTAAARWSVLEDIVESRGWPDRLVVALEQSLAGGATRASYSHEAAIANPTASGDFRRLVDAGLVDLNGAGRSTHYVASPRLVRIVAETG